MDNRQLIASEGMVLTNGEVYVAEVWLGDWDSAENWREITQEEATRSDGGCDEEMEGG